MVKYFDFGFCLTFFFIFLVCVNFVWSLEAFEAEVEVESFERAEEESVRYL